MSAISGSTAYDILILSGLAILLGGALARRGRQPSLAADRWAIASGMLAGLQGLRLLTAAWAPTSSFLPLLDRLFSVLLPSLLGWAALGPETGEGADRILTGVVVLAGGLFAASALLGPAPAGFNTSVLDQVWSLFALGAAATALLAILVRRPPQWGVFIGALGLLVAGDVAHIATIPFTASSAPYVLLAEALAVPVFTIGAVWTLLREPPALSRGAPPAAKDRAVPGTLQAMVALSAADSAPAFADALTQAIGTSTGAAYCLLLTPPDEAGAISIGAGFDLERRAPVREVLLDSGRCPVLAQAMISGNAIRLPAGANSPDSRTILQALGVGGKRPLLLVPLPADRRTVAGLVLLSSGTEREWDDSTQILLQQIAPALGARLLAWMSSPRPGAPVGDVAQELARARLRIAELESSDHHPPPAGESELIGVDDLRSQLDDARRTIEILETEIDRLKATFPPAGTPASEVSQRLQAELALALEALSEARSAEAPSSPIAASPPAPRDGPAVSIHGARQPLTAISGYTELLLGESIGLLGTTQRRFLERIRFAVRRIDGQLTALAETLRQTQASVPGLPSELGALIEQALEVIHEDLRAKNLSVRLDLPAAPTPVPGNPDSIRTVVARLLANAADVTPAGREILLSVLPNATEGLVLMTVSDLGQGVAASDLGRVFSSDIWDEPVQGLGRDAAGLTMVKTLTEALGGRVWVESRPSGTTFSVLLPSVVEE